jgi:integrase
VVKPEDAANSYIAHCQARNLSPNSVTCYRHALGWLVRFLPVVDFADITPTEINAAWSEIAASEELGPNTLRLYRVIMASWLDWCVLLGGLHCHALRSIPLPPKVKPFRPKVTRSLFYALRKACDQLESEYIRRRAIAMMAVLYSTLVRRAELMVLRISHLRLDEVDPVLYIECGKGGWSGWLPMGDSTASALRAWLKVRGDAPHDWLWCNEGEQRLRMGWAALYKLLSRLAGIAHIPDLTVKPHAMRRGSSTERLQSGKDDLGTVSLALRHKSILTTMDYVEASTSKLAASRNWMENLEQAEERQLEAAIKEASSAAQEALDAAMKTDIARRQEDSRRDRYDRDLVKRPPRHREPPPAR